MLLPPNAACLTMMDNVGAGNVNPGMFKDFQIIPGRERKAGSGSCEIQGRISLTKVRTENSRG